MTGACAFSQYAGHYASVAPAAQEDIAPLSYWKSAIGGSSLMQPQQNALQRINWTTMSYFGKTGRAIRIAIALAAVACGAGCRTAENTSPLPPTKIQQSKFSDYRPQNPFRLSKAGLLERELFVANKGPGYKVELRELLVPPKQR